MRIPRLTDPILIRHLAPGAKRYSYVVTQDDFDEYDNEAAGEYYGVYVSEHVAQHWDLGLDQCKVRDIDPKSEDGVSLRYRVMHGEGKAVPRALLTWARRRAAEAQAKRDADEATRVTRASAVAAYEAHFVGMTNVGCDSYSADFWPCTARAQLAVIAELDTSTGPEIWAQHWKKAYRLPNGDMLEILDGKSWVRWTADESIIVDRQMRARIHAHRYDRQLFAALAELEVAGALRCGVCSWFGGSVSYDDGVVPAYGAIQNSTGPEKVARLRAHLTECVERHPTFADALRDALTLAVSGSITEITDRADA